VRGRRRRVQGLERCRGDRDFLRSPQGFLAQADLQLFGLAASLGSPVWASITRPRKMTAGGSSAPRGAQMNTASARTSGRFTTIMLPQDIARGYDGAMSEEDIKAEIDRLKDENERLKARQSRAISLKVSEKGGLSVYGLGPFPVTLYKEQWTKLLDMADDIRAFLKENDARLKSKS